MNKAFGINYFVEFFRVFLWDAFIFEFFIDFIDEIQRERITSKALDSKIF